MEFSPDSKTIASATRDNSIKFWDVTTGKLISTFNGHSSWVYSVAFCHIQVDNCDRPENS
ncbi:WD40 repeat domain-containing protein [Nostoc sp. FACHB-190]|uniref:WD40 repeat domain-containing protein n=1 Tax=Nostoc sp. FACHB-190 TaxID=2692838 RepID=UPI0037C5DF0E